MIEEYGWSIVISVYLVYALGTGLLMYAILFVWEHVLDRLMTLFRIKKMFVLFVRNYYRKERPISKPKLSEERMAELKAGLTRKKEDEE